ncbi:MAG: fumarylacetoacetate hydrolase family protein [Alphaproteobacteria bacterium]
MKLGRLGPIGQEKPAIMDAEGNWRDLSSHISDITPATLADGALEKIKSLNLEELPLADQNQRVGACVGDIHNFICIGLNYAQHAAETGADIPKEPIVFNKTTSAVCGPNDHIIIPRNSIHTDWETELGVVIGKRAHYVSEEDALDYVAGYCVINDVSERTFQKDRGGQWTKGKSSENFGPTGPWLVTADEVSDPQNLNLWLKVNGQMMQNNSTSDMIFNLRQIIAHLTEFMVLSPGDVIATGTPEGVGSGMNPPVYLKPGDVVELGVEGLGVQRQEVVAAS